MESTRASASATKRLSTAPSASTSSGDSASANDDDDDDDDCISDDDEDDDDDDDDEWARSHAPMEVVRLPHAVYVMGKRKPGTFFIKFLLYILSVTDTVAS
eukprot:4010734-Pleurochrysis_carterae.AAC.1